MHETTNTETLNRNDDGKGDDRRGRRPRSSPLTTSPGATNSHYSLKQRPKPTVARVTDMPVLYGHCRTDKEADVVRFRGPP
ncbi:hypothetical protein BaRGS_00007884 [Batillaria attramentaria]|uniref:Uncharacterized protein n=1 Tax=Batillaria attramentaria TaxID=370345 RepID=A0ABD0LN06_9CAEN